MIVLPKFDSFLSIFVQFSIGTKFYGTTVDVKYVRRIFLGGGMRKEVVNYVVVNVVAPLFVSYRLELHLIHGRISYSVLTRSREQHLREINICINYTRRRLFGDVCV